MWYRETTADSLSPTQISSSVSSVSAWEGVGLETGAGVGVGRGPADGVGDATVPGGVVADAVGRETGVGLPVESAAGCRGDPRLGDVGVGPCTVGVSRSPVHAIRATTSMGKATAEPSDRFIYSTFSSSSDTDPSTIRKARTLGCSLFRRDTIM